MRKVAYVVTVWLVLASGVRAQINNIVADATDGYIWGLGAMYATARTQVATPGSPFNSTSTYLGVGQLYTGTQIQVWRAFLTFDTSGVSGVNSANLIMAFSTDSTTERDFNVVIREFCATFPIDGTTDGANYTGCLNASAAHDIVWKSTAGLSTGVEYSVALPNISWIKSCPTNRTSYCLLSSQDIGVSAPTGSEYVTIISADETSPHLGCTTNQFCKPVLQIISGPTSVPSSTPTTTNTPVPPFTATPIRTPTRLPSNTPAPGCTPLDCTPVPRCGQPLPQ